MEAIGEWGGLDTSSERPVEELRKGYSYFADGDILVAKITPCFENGKGAIATGLVNGAGFGTTELHVLSPRHTLNRGFLFWVTMAAHFRRKGEAEMYGAGGQKRVPESFLRDFQLAFPAVEYQRRIASFLDRETGKIDRLVAKKRRLIELLEEKRTALITRAVTRGLDPNAPTKPSGIDWLGDVPQHWDATRLKQVASVVDCKHRTVPFADDGLAVVSIGEVQGRYVDLATAKRTSPSEFNLMVEGGRLPRDGDIVFSRNATVGLASLVRDETFCLGQDVCLIRPSDVESRFLYETLRARHVAKMIESITVGATFARINISDIREFPVTLPPPEEQQVIATACVEAHRSSDSVRRKIQTAIDSLTEYRSALITAAVTGQIDVTRPAAEPEEVADAG